VCCQKPSATDLSICHLMIMCCTLPLPCLDFTYMNKWQEFLLLNQLVYKLFMHCLPIVADRSQTASEKDGEGFSIQQFTGCSTTCHYAACIHTKHNSTDRLLLSGY
jgi:hypothetical protein